MRHEAAIEVLTKKTGQTALPPAQTGPGNAGLGERSRIVTAQATSVCVYADLLAPVAAASTLLGLAILMN